jgi:hypothetical protein
MFLKLQMTISSPPTLAAGENFTLNHSEYDLSFNLYSQTTLGLPAKAAPHPSNAFSEVLSISSKSRLP